VIVVDSTAVTDALTGAPGSDGVRAVLAGEELHAPALLDYQVVAAVRALTRGGHLSPGRAVDVLTDFEDLPLWRWAAAAPLRRRALQLGGTGTGTDDAAYVALAQALGCPLVTRDAGLARGAGHLVAVTLV
jgi:predicted nucleic acid-binding protein